MSGIVYVKENKNIKKNWIKIEYKGMFDLLKRHERQNNVEQVAESYDNFLYCMLFESMHNTSNFMLHFVWCAYALDKIM